MTSQSHLGCLLEILITMPHKFPLHQNGEDISWELAFADKLSEILSYIETLAKHCPRERHKELPPVVFNKVVLILTMHRELKTSVVMEKSAFAQQRDSSLNRIFGFQMVWS